MENYNLALDAGGTKVCGILYDAAFRPVRACRVGSIRSNTSTREQIQHHIEELIDGLQLRGTVLTHVGGAMFGGLVEPLKQVCTLKETEDNSEMQLGLAAAGIFGDGCMALSGTGAGLRVNYNGKSYSTGGYGAIVSDEGSGYWIGREALGAAIKDDDGRGPRTMLTDLIARRLGSDRKHFRDGVFNIYRQGQTSPATAVASCAALVSEAAYQGDPAALDILKRAGAVLAQQLTSVIRKYDLPKSLPITISGSVWRGHPVLFEEFSRGLLEFGMEQKVTIPDFEPIVGAIIFHYYKEHGAFKSEDKERFKILYQDYLFEVGGKQKWN